MHSIPPKRFAGRHFADKRGAAVAVIAGDMEKWRDDRCDPPDRADEYLSTALFTSVCGKCPP
jgi:hypothetical protein